MRLPLADERKPMTLPPPESVACDLCGATAVDVLRPAFPSDRSERDPSRMFSASSAVRLLDRLVKCRGCGLVYVSPRVPARAILDAYGHGEDAVYLEQLAARARSFEALLRRMELLTGGPGRIFDVGAAAGTFLGAAQRRGWTVDGCEPNAWLAAHGQRAGIPIRTGTLDDVASPGVHVDAVTFWDVIEHLPAPSAALTQAAALLEPGGWLFLTFPDIGSRPARMLGMRWPLLRAMHLYYFSGDTMRRMLDRAGFDTVSTTPYTPVLEAGYLLNRTVGTLGAPGRALARLGRRLGAKRVYLPLALGQTFVAARRRPD